MAERIDSILALTLADIAMSTQWKDFAEFKENFIRKFSSPDLMRIWFYSRIQKNSREELIEKLERHFPKAKS